MVNCCPTCGFKSFTPTILLPPNKTTHIRELLRAHTKPPEHLESTISELSAELTRYGNERARYDKEITRLRAILSAVESERATLLAEHAALQAHFDDCQGLSLRSPVKRLPVETLLAIFWMCSKPFPPTVALWADREKHRHAHAPLFAVSQSGALGRSSTWCCRLEAPLRPILVKHSQWWKTATFTGERLSKGRFPVLETLELHLVEIQTVTPATGDLFHTTSPATAEFGMHRRHVTQSDLSPIVNGWFILWDNMSPYTSTCLERFLTSYSVSKPNVVQRRNSFDILANLTLPCLENLTFRSDYFSPLPWPHSDVLALSSRSSFHTHLQSLNISDCSIGAAELIECLSALPSVQRLEISDDHRDGVEPIINNFFSRGSLSNQISRLSSLISGTSSSANHSYNLTTMSSSAFSSRVARVSSQPRAGRHRVDTRVMRAELVAVDFCMSRAPHVLSFPPPPPHRLLFMIALDILWLAYEYDVEYLLRRALLHFETFYPNAIDAQRVYGPQTPDDDDDNEDAEPTEPT
ncbi:hypothetical protein DFH08DRAFT_975454 [Mycena albidolilacea]|uniref:F-box domain-containing protein n=1 Tax=Mycena albidolilacea TaxID=1033008 RepID=A0AAD6Z4K0_9AGAR|nr:hypothetical protein DFH08DRAFT_975454 [Mycena albidolilacea]